MIMLMLKNILICYNSTGLHDSQVQYWEPAKWVAKLRTIKTDKNIIITQIPTWMLVMVELRDVLKHLKN